MAPPLYVMITHSIDKSVGIDALERTVIKIEEVIKKNGGASLVKMKVSEELILFLFIIYSASSCQ